MPTLTFLPGGQSIEITPGTKVLAAALRNGIEIRYGCGACCCGTCGVQIQGEFSPMEMPERALLERMGLALDGTIRLACQCRIMTGEGVVDLDFQRTYSP